MKYKKYKKVKKAREPRISYEKKEGYTTFWGLWDGVDKDGNPTGGAMWANDQDAARWEKENKRR